MLKERFSLKDIPKYEIIQRHADTYSTVDPSALETFLTLVHSSTELINAGSDYLHRIGMSPGRFGVMMILNQTPDTPLSPSELAEKLDVTRATITGLLDGLNREGYIERKQDANDRRSITVNLTPKAFAFFKSFLPGHFDRISRLIEPLSQEERKTLIRLLMKISANLDVFRNARPELEIKPEQNR